MELKKFMIEVQTNYLDKNKMVKPQIGWNDSGNGLLYTAEAIAIAKLLGNKNMDFLQYDLRVRECYYKYGCLMRTPDNQFGQQQWDDYMGVAVGCISIGNTKIPREILKYAVTHFFIMDNNGTKETKDFLLRFPHVWLLMFVAAFPLFIHVLSPIFRLITRLLLKFKPGQGSGQTNLQFMWNMGMHFLGMHDLLDKFLAEATLVDHLKSYFNEANPFYIAMKDYLKK